MVSLLPEQYLVGCCSEVIFITQPQKWALVSYGLCPFSEILEAVDKDANSGIDFEEFLILMVNTVIAHSKQPSPLKLMFNLLFQWHSGDHSLEIAEAFELFDQDGDGYITKAELR